MKNFINKYFQYILAGLFIFNNLFLYRIKMSGFLIIFFMAGLTAFTLICYKKNHNKKQEIPLLIIYSIGIIVAKDLINTFYAMIVSTVIYFSSFKSTPSPYKIIIILYLILNIINLTFSVINARYYHIKSDSVYYCKSTNTIYYKYKDKMFGPIRYGKATYYPIIPLKLLIDISYQDRERIDYNEYKDHIFAKYCNNSYY